MFFVGSQKEAETHDGLVQNDKSSGAIVDLDMLSLSAVKLKFQGWRWLSMFFYLSFMDILFIDHLIIMEYTPTPHLSNLETDEPNVFETIREGFPFSSGFSLGQELKGGN